MRRSSSSRSTAYIIVDVEATCWSQGTKPGRQEIIEIGAVALDPLTLDIVSEFSRFVRPVVEPVLSDFCRELTTITQADVDPAPTFPAAFAAFLEWVGEDWDGWSSWGGYDLTQFRVDARRHCITLPDLFESHHVNLKEVFAGLYQVKGPTMKGALDLMGLPLIGTHHRGLDDARNIARLAKLILPRLPW